MKLTTFIIIIYDSLSVTSTEGKKSKPHFVYNSNINPYPQPQSLKFIGHIVKTGGIKENVGYL